MPIPGYGDEWGSKAIRISNRRSSKYMDDFFRLKCGPDLMINKLFPNAKEVTESLGAFWALLKFTQWDLSDPDTVVIVPGDGQTPRTGAVFAMRSKWHVSSIDPQAKKTDYPIDRLTVIKSTVAECEQRWIAAKRVAIVHVHSHAKIHESLQLVDHAEKLVVVAIPCCVDQWIDGKMPNREYIDRGIWSPKNVVRCWDLGTWPNS